jgi:hypothetical protein
MRKLDSNSIQKGKARSVKWANYERGKTKKKKLPEPKVENDGTNTSG